MAPIDRSGHSRNLAQPGKDLFRGKFLLDITSFFLTLFVLSFNRAQNSTVTSFMLPGH